MIYSADDNNDDGTFDVVADHQHCNHKPKPPSADCLHCSAVHHKSWPRQITELDEEVDEDEIVPNLEEEEIFHQMKKILILMPLSCPGSVQNATQHTMMLNQPSFTSIREHG